MKKILCKMMAIAAVTLSFTALTSCEDVPAPYEIPGQGGDDTPGENSLPYNDDNLSDWTPVTVKGAAWSLGSSYAKATGYNGSGYDETEAWLVSPEITLPQVSGAVINFDHVIRYVFNDADLANHEMYISSDYTGDVKTATWTKLGYTPVASATNTWDFYAANTIAVPQEYLGKKVVVAFKFVCSTSNSTTWEVKNFSITEGTLSESSLPYTDDNLSDWGPVTVKGAAWSLGNSYAKATGYNGSGYTETEAWLVSPEITLPAVNGAVINFDHVIRYVFNDADLANHEMYISSDYNGDVKTATWTKLDYKPVASPTNTWDFYAANTIAVPQEYLGKKVVVAFKFVCSTSNSTTWEVKNFSITEGTGGDQPSTPTGDALNISGTTVTLTNTAAEAGTESVSIDCSTLGYENAQDAGTVKFSDGTTLTFDGNGETNTPKYYEKTGGFRVYKNNKMIFAGVKKIARIIMTCDAYNGIDYVGNATATVEVSGNNLVYTNLYTEAQGGGVQLRVQTIKIIYAK